MNFPGWTAILPVRSGFLFAPHLAGLPANLSHETVVDPQIDGLLIDSPTADPPGRQPWVRAPSTLRPAASQGPALSSPLFVALSCNTASRAQRRRSVEVRRVRQRPSQTIQPDPTASRVFLGSPL